jgi:mono/diheme cytochrome c family protein
VARGHLNADVEFYTGKAGEQFSKRFPFPITRGVLARGQERFNIYCSPCHGRLGTGDGMIVRRGFRAPPSYHTDRLRNVADGYIYDVITNGFGAMQDYAAQVEPRDRWAIVAYVRALQYSRQAAIADVPADKRGELGGGVR